MSGVRFGSASELGVYLRSYASDLVAQSGPVLLLGFGMTLVLMTAGIDLSVGSMVALVACVMSSFPTGPQFWWTAVPIGLALALLLGLTNGALIAYLDVPPIIATLGNDDLFYRGMCFVVMGELEKAPFVDVPGYEWFGQFLGAAVLVAAVLRGVVVASPLPLAPGNPHARVGTGLLPARYAGIPVTRRLCQVYTDHGFSRIPGGFGLYRAEQLRERQFTFWPGVACHCRRGPRGHPRSGEAPRWMWKLFGGVDHRRTLDEGLRGASSWGDRHLPFKVSHLEYILLGLLLLGAVWLSTVGRRRGKRRRRDRPTLIPNSLPGLNLKLHLKLSSRT